MSSKSICFAHGKDIDGIASASIIKMATGAQVTLVDYSNLIEKLSATKAADRVYICDIGLNGSLAELFLNEVERIRQFASVFYIDHHPLKLELKDKLRFLGVDLNHSLDECTSVLAFLKFGDSLKDGSSIIAAYGAVTDFMDDQPNAKKIIYRYDRQFVLLESTLLSHALLGAIDNASFKKEVVEGLSTMKFPHEIVGVMNYAKVGLERISHMMSEVAKRGLKSHYTAYIDAKEAPTGTMATLLIGAFDVPVGIAYRLIKNEDVYSLFSS